MEQAMHSMGLKPGDEEFTKAKQLWEMMDDMSTSDPEGYQAFIKKQMADRQKFMKANAPATPKFCVRIRDGKSKRDVCINFSESTRVKAPDDKVDGGAIPVVVLEPSDEVDTMNAPVLLYEAAFHPTILEKLVDDEEYKEAIIELGLGCVEDRSKQIKSRPALKLDRTTMKVKTKPFKKHTLEDKIADAKRAADAPFEMKMPGEQSSTAADAGGAGAGQAKGSSAPGGGLMDQLGSIIGGAGAGAGGGGDSGGIGGLIGGDGGSSGSVMPEVTIPGLSTGANAAKSAAATPVVIEEMASAGGGDQTSSGVDVPIYTVTRDDDERQVVLRVEMPKIASVADVELDVETKKITLCVPGVYELECELPCAVDKDAAKAKFKKKQRALYLTMAMA